MSGKGKGCGCQQIFWIAVVLTCFGGASRILYNTVVNWNSYPRGSTILFSHLFKILKYTMPCDLVVNIKTFSFPATNLTFPAITVCKTYKYDVGDYIR